MRVVGIQPEGALHAKPSLAEGRIHELADVETVAESAGAAPIAALFSDALDVTGEYVAAVVSGANVDLTAHGALVRIGLGELDRSSMPASKSTRGRGLWATS